MRSARYLPEKNVFRERLKSSIDVVLSQANVLAVSSRHEGRRTRMLVGSSLSCCTEGNSVDFEWRSAVCGVP